MMDFSNRLDCTYHQLAEDIANEIERHCKEGKDAVPPIPFAIALAGAFIAKAIQDKINESD